MSFKRKTGKDSSPASKKIISKKKLILLLIILAALFYFGYRLFSFINYAYFYRSSHEEYSKEFKTNTDAIYSKEYFLKTLSKYGVKDSEEAEKLYEDSFIIPGLKTTRTLIDSEHTATCTSMTPQGVCVAGPYLLISAYCGTGKHNSVIYVIDKSTHKFLKEVVLRGRPHVGGVTFDPVHKNVWFCDYSGKKQTAFVSAISLEDLQKYDIEENNHPIHYQDSVPIYSLQRTSFIDYYSGKLYVGHYENSLSSLTTIQTFTIDDETGGLVSSDVYEWDTLKKDDVILPSKIMTIQSRIQGFTINDTKSAMSTSHGILSSRMMIYDSKNESEISGAEDSEIDDGLRYLDDPDITYSLPPMLEQISDSNGKLYLCFESAAYSYRARLNRKIDRILFVDF